MLSRVNAILESEGIEIAEKHEELLSEAVSCVTDFQKDLKAFILDNPQEFIGENVEETYKNMRVFSEVAISQYMTEVTNICGEAINEQEIVETKADIDLGDYL